MLFAVVINLTLLVFRAVNTQSVPKKSNQLSHVANAIPEIVEKLSEQHSMKFDVLVYGYNVQLQVLAKDIIKKIANGTHAINIKQKNHNESVNSQSVHESKIILASHEIKIDTKTNFTNDEEDELRYQFYHDHNSVMIFYFLNESNVTLYLNISQKIFRFMRPRVFFIAHSKDKNSKNLKLYGFDKYPTSLKCNIFNLILRNTFTVSEMKWTHQTFHEEYKNFKGCPIFVQVLYKVACTLDFQSDNSGKIRLGGFYGDLIHIYANKHNANVQVVDSKALKNFLSQIDIILLHTTAFYKLPRYNMFSPTVPIDEHRIAFLVKRGRAFTPFEKLILPFDPMTWYLNIFTILAGYLVIFILYQLPVYMQKFVFGTFNRDPSMSVTQIFFGIGLIQTPGRNFARFMFMMFTIFCLIMRTAYQGKMFDFLQYNVRQPSLKTIDEVLKHKIPLSRFGVFFSDELEEKLGNIAHSPTQQDFDDCFKDESDRLSAFVTDRYYYECQKATDPDFSNSSLSTRMTDDDFVSGLNSWYIFKYSIVHKSLNRFLLECHQHGIIAYMTRKHQHSINDQNEEQPKVLTMKMLSAGFYVWLAFIGIACAVFVLEHIHKPFRSSHVCVQCEAKSVKKCKKV